MDKTVPAVCGQCGKNTDVVPDKLGKKMRCPRCKAVAVFDAPVTSMTPAAPDTFVDDPDLKNLKPVDDDATETIQLSVIPDEPDLSADKTIVEDDATSTMEVTVLPDPIDSTEAQKTIVEGDSADPAGDTADKTLIEPEPLVTPMMAKDTLIEDTTTSSVTQTSPVAPNETLIDDSNLGTQTMSVQVTSASRPALKTAAKHPPSIVTELKERKEKIRLWIMSVSGVAGAIASVFLMLYLVGTFDSKTSRLKQEFHQFMYDLEHARSTIPLMRYVNTDDIFQKEAGEDLFRQWIETARIRVEGVEITEVKSVAHYGHVKFNIEYVLENKTASSPLASGSEGSETPPPPVKKSMTVYWIYKQERWYFDALKKDQKQMPEEYLKPPQEPAPKPPAES